MNIVLWIIQGLLALAFGMTGFMKLSQPKEKLEPQMAYMEDFSQGTIRVIGLLELLGAIGLILSALTGILPFLTPLAALGLVLIMIGAMLTHLRRKEYPMIAVNLAVLVMAAVVIYGRFVAFSL